ncbi:MAG: hypothetical protein LC123_10020 [Burkholderiales bacterium]|jgi:Tfp pilus assembly protein PilX|uniref:Type 4 fimbrial biogenesis protein PilX N-terminal domain-containing protein n=1 Tax=Candidatus Desulfobacillus denitrificans TaxID=2608985 RepID=A0A809R1Q8_9PROT|nr:hypothetical protein [Zoogloeaceae bacterium]MBV6411425.1 hypothetical protein [Rhodocyclaceae bacterium]MCZ2173344.1 hypothetical protein [Burkholderiales bacterium]OQY70498.1 MAG: hypothetical protein B6D47_07365 [Rhodocyclaceae bacterium UTPRO2]BBO21560.1 conserved hypothetical protein [Candidatus Desulfobacillus denitrificans]GIK46395.1 MAG: hypothetical protein BroJett012_22980 [Betaproteobacteria bacterium]
MLNPGFLVPRAQRGVVLIVSLVVLAVMTLLVIGMLRTSVIELKLGGVTHQAELNFSNAEAMISTYINENNGRFSRDCLMTADAALSCFTTADGTTTVAGTAPNRTMTKSLEGSTVTLSVQQIACADDSGVGSGNQLGGGLQALFLDVQAVSTGAFSGRSTVHQGIKTPLPPGSCQ